jgi:hypothetical protein
MLVIYSAHAAFYSKLHVIVNWKSCCAIGDFMDEELATHTVQASY